MPYTPATHETRSRGRPPKKAPRWRAVIHAVDGAAAPVLDRDLARLGENELHARPELAFARGRLLAMRERSGEALGYFLDALAMVEDRDRLLLSRIVFEAGCIYLRRNELLAADALVASARARLGMPEPADLLHLEALLVEGRGDGVGARDLYRRAVADSATALTPATTVLAVRNLASLLVHDQPREAEVMTELGLKLIDSHRLDARLRGSLLNLRAYALICCGELGRAEDVIEQAGREAAEHGQKRLGLQAAFNRAVIAELRGEFDGALAGLTLVGNMADQEGQSDLSGWARLRLAWVHLAVGEVDIAAEMLRKNFPERVGEPYRRSVETLVALLVLARGQRAIAARRFAELSSSYAAEADHLTAFVLLLWEAHARAGLGHIDQARRPLTQAADLGRRGDFRISPNWWSAALRRTAIDLAEREESQTYFGNLISIDEARSLPSRPKVEVLRSGEIRISESPMPPDGWRQGKTGPNVLRHYLDLLIRSHPRSVSRDELIDQLWPESDGDRAIRNLYGATYDLRLVLAGVPGLRLIVEGQSHRLAADQNVHVGGPVESSGAGT